MMAAVLVLGLGSASGVLTPQSAPSFAGVWERDPDRSDDSEEKMRAALQEMQEQMERRRGGPVPGGPGPGGPENRSRGGAEVGQVPEELQI
ncbi:MAG: hypothetical protein ACRD21_23530, partial [Vicinamibacteria bacterium]